MEDLDIEMMDLYAQILNEVMYYSYGLRLEGFSEEEIINTMKWVYGMV